MRKRIPYFFGFLALLAAEIYIGACVRDDFVRPYVGDVLVTALLGCLVRTVWPDRWKLLPVWVFLFALAVECSQLLNLPRLLGLEGTVLAVMMGSSFSRADILCYALGCILFWLFDRLCGNSTRQKQDFSRQNR